MNLPPDVIELRGLRFVAAHGALQEERERAQPFEVDLDLHADLREAGRTDDLGRTVDYASVCEAVRAVVEGAHVELLETLAERVAEQVLEVAGLTASAVTVWVRKLRPPVAFELTSVAVRAHRTRS